MIGRVIRRPFVSGKKKKKIEIRYSGEGKWIRVPPPPISGTRNKQDAAGVHEIDGEGEPPWLRRRGTAAAALAAVLVAADFLSASEVESVFALRCLRLGAWGVVVPFITPQLSLNSSVISFIASKKRVFYLS